jgi:hypothetical protein
VLTTWARTAEGLLSRPVTHPFLSDEWLDAVKAINQQHAGESTSTPYSIKMNQVITDAPFGDGTVKIYMDTSSGSVVMDRGELPDAEVTVTTDYATAKSIFVDQDQAAAMQAFMSGKVKVQGDMMKLMAMNANAPDEVARTVAAEIKAVTEA